jgi:hypothetical protein
VIWGKLRRPIDDNLLESGLHLEPKKNHCLDRLLRVKKK